MDPDLFKKKLEEFAELKQIKVPRSAAVREVTEPAEIYRNGREFVVDADNNQTLGWVIKKMKPVTAVCEDCELVVSDRVVDIKVYENPKQHRRKNCKACGLVQNPFTGKYTVANKESHSTYAAWVNNKPEPIRENTEEVKQPVLKPVYKKPTK